MSSRSEQPYGSVACLVDTADTVLARSLVSHASRWSAATDARLAVVHVDSWLPPLRSRHSIWQLDEPHLMDEVREWLEALCTRVPRADPVLLSSPDPPGRAAGWAADEGIDMLVVAAHNGLFPPPRMGSFAGPLAALSPVPVLVIPHALLALGEQPPSDPPRRIACCLDESRSSEAALSEARRLADVLPGAHLSLVHGAVHPRLVRMLGLSRVLPSRPWRERQVVARLAASASAVPRSSFVVLDGRPRDVAAWAAEHDFELLVAGAGQNPTGVRWPGSFAHEVAVHAECPVLLVPPRPGTDRRPVSGSHAAATTVRDDGQTLIPKEDQ